MTNRWSSQRWSELPVEVDSSTVVDGVSVQTCVVV